MNLNGKRVDLPQLRTEMVASGLNVPALGQQGDWLHTYTAQGAIIDVPPSAQAVVDAHVPPAPTPRPDVADASVDGQVASAVANLRTYLAAPNPTAADSTAALKLLIRVVLWILKRLVMVGLFPP